MDLLELAKRVEQSSGDTMLDREAACALGWQERRVGHLGLNGRTAGSYRWFEPGNPKPKSLPHLTGPRKRVATANALRARATLTKDSRP